MKEGFWLNSNNYKYAGIDDHARWISEPKNATKMGLPKEFATFVAKQKDPLANENSRIKILLKAMDYGLIRVRAHGTDITFEFTESSKDALEAIQVFCKKTGMLGPFSRLNIHNLRTNENIAMPYSEFEENMDEGYDKVLRIAKKLTRYENYKTVQGFLLTEISKKKN